MRTLSLCTCCRHYPGAASGRIVSLSHPAVSAFPERVVGSACASSFSRLARRSLALRPAHSRCHQFVTRIPKASAISSPPQLLRLLPAGAVAGLDSHPLESTALPRRTPIAVIKPAPDVCEPCAYSLPIGGQGCSLMPPAAMPSPGSSEELLDGRGWKIHERHLLKRSPWRSHLRPPAPAYAPTKLW